MEIGHSAEELGHIFSIATGPAFFLGAIAAFLSLMLGRLNSVLARFKEIGSLGAGLLFLIANCLVAGSLVMFALDVRRDIQIVPNSRRET